MQAQNFLLCMSDDVRTLGECLTSNWIRILYFTSHADPRTKFSSIGSTHDNATTTMSAVNNPQSLQELEVVNEGYTENENMAESTFAESALAMEYRIRLVQDFKLLVGGNEIMVSKVKV